jgi:catechol 2,3-dioxygenase-like lactoylglutathione lyase family enzyme
MITNVSLANVYVSDQDAARDFYVNTLGFELRSDVTMGDGFRWLTVGVRGQDDLEVVLYKPGPPQSPEDAETSRTSLPRASSPAWDCTRRGKTFEELARKATFLRSQDRPYGIEAVLRDNSGNGWCSQNRSTREPLA